MTFKAWHKTMMCWYAIDYMILDNPTGRIKAVGIGIDFDEGGTSIDEVILVESIGLKDKHEVNIHRGDIVLVDEYYIGDSVIKSHYAEVVFSEGCYILVHPTLVDGCVGDHILNNRLTIVGNTYENPELIEK